MFSNSSDRARAHAFLIELNSKLKKQLQHYPNLNLSPVLSDKMEKRQNRYHFHILVSAIDRKILSDFLDMTSALVATTVLSADTRFAIEVDPLTMY